MKIKDKIKSYSFWVSLASAVILILKLLGNRFGFTVDETMISDLFTALCSVLVLLGIIVVPSSQSNISTQNNIQFNQKNTNSTNNLNQKNSIESVETTSENKISELADFAINNSYNEELTINNQKEVLDFNTSDNNTNTSETLCYETTDNTVANDNTKQDTNLSNESIQFQSEQTFNSNVSLSLPLSENTAMEELNPLPHEEIIIDLLNLENNSIKISNQESSTTTNTNSEESCNNDFLDLKEILNSKRAEYSNNINEYILELQEEIRKAREQM